MPQKSKFRKWVGIVLNVLIIAFGVGLVGFWTKTYILTSESKVLKVGDQISHPEVSPGTGKKGLWVFLKSDCIHCTKSAEFYKTISKEIAESSNLYFLTVFSKKDSRRAEYLAEIGMSNVNSVQVSYTDLGIVGTPTIVLMDENGIVEELWRGKLSKRREIELKQKLALPVADWYIDESELNELKKRERNLKIIDLQGREKYIDRHIEGAKNIPFDEIQPRAVNELSLADTIVLYGQVETDSDAAHEILLKEGFTKVYILTFNTSFNEPF